MRATFRVAENFEVTVECNPSSLDDCRASRLVEVGVDRLSVGVQSLRDHHLRHLGRLHDAEGARRALRAALTSGASRVSADFIFGLPGQSPAEAQGEALELADLTIAHLSCYQLTIESGTRFGELARLGRLRLADEAAVADSYLAIDEALEMRGFRHYEISNYGLAGHECRHNLGYWRGDEYLGLGCAAVGFIRAKSEGRPSARAGGVRWRNPESPRIYMAGGTSAIADRRRSKSSMARRCSANASCSAFASTRASTSTRPAADLGVVGWTKARAGAADALEKKGHLVRVGVASTFRNPLGFGPTPSPATFLKRRGTRGPSPHRPGALDGA